MIMPVAVAYCIYCIFNHLTAQAWQHALGYSSQSQALRAVLYFVLPSGNSIRFERICVHN